MPDDPDTLSAAKLLARIKQLTAGEIRQLADAARELEAAGLGPAVGLAGLDAELKTIPCRRADLLNEAYADAEAALAVVCEPAGIPQDHPVYLEARRAIRNAAAALTMWDLLHPDGTRLLLYPWLRLTRPDLQPPVSAEDYDENRQAWEDILRAAREQDEARQPPGPRVLAPRRLRYLTAHVMAAADPWQTRELRALVAGLDAGHIAQEEFAERDALLCASLDFDDAEQELARTLAGPLPRPEPERSRCVHCGADIYRASPRARWCLTGFDQVIGGGWLRTVGDRNVFARFNPRRCDRREINGYGRGGHQPQPARPAASQPPSPEGAGT